MPRKKKNRPEVEKMDSKPQEDSPKAERSQKRGVQHARKGGNNYRNFDEFWFAISKARKLEPRWREPLRAHLKAAGFWSPEKYEEGLKHFGL